MCERSRWEGVQPEASPGGGEMPISGEISLQAETRGKLRQTCVVEDLVLGMGDPCPA